MIPSDPSEQKRLFLSQDEKIMRSVRDLAEAVGTLPSDPRFGQNHPHVLVVGGFVRDSLCGLSPKDVDLQVYGVDPADLERLLSERFGDRIKRVGKQYEILKLTLEDSLEFDISIARRGIGDEHSSHDAGDPALSPRDAATLRDFTMNSLAADPLTGEVLDFWGGLEDLRARRLRVTDPQSFVTRPLHLYRAAQFSARLELAPDRGCRELLEVIASSGRLSELTSRIVTEEYRKLFSKGRKPSLGLALLKDLGILEKTFPLIAASLTRQASRIDAAAWLRMADSIASRRNEFEDEPEATAAMLAVFLSPLLNLGTAGFKPAALESLAQLTFGPAIVAAALCSLIFQDRIAEIHRRHARSAPPAPIKGKFARLPGARPVKAEHLQELEALCAEAYPCGMRQLSAIHQALPGLGKDAQIWFARESARLSSDKIRSTLITKEDLKRELKASSGPALGYIIGKIEGRRYELITKAAALAYLKEHGQALLAEAQSAAQTPEAIATV